MSPGLCLSWSVQTLGVSAEERGMVVQEPCRTKPCGVRVWAGPPEISTDSDYIGQTV